MVLALTLALAGFPSFVADAGEPAVVNVTRDFFHRQWGTREGLPEMGVQCLAQTSDGYLWIGTRRGLVRFDGVRFVTITRANTGILEDDDCRALVPDSRGGLWLNTYAQPGLYSLRDSLLAPAWQGDPKSAPNFESPAPCREGGVWVREDSQGWTRWSDRREKTATSSRVDSEARYLHETPAHVLYAFGNGLAFRSGSSNGSWAEWSLPVHDGPGAVVQVADDRAGRVWFRYGEHTKIDRRLYRFDDAGPVAIGEPLAANAGRTEFLVGTRDGALWAPAGDFSLNRILDGQIIRYSLPRDRAEDFCLSLIEDREGNLWVGTESSGLHLLRPRRFQAVTTDDGLPHANVRTVLTAKDTVWIGSDAGVSRLSTSQRAAPPDAVDRGFSAIQDLHGPLVPGSSQPRSVRALALGPAGRLWVGSDRGLFAFTNESFTAVTLPNVPRVPDSDTLGMRKIRALAVDGSGGLWIAGAEHLAWLPLAPDSQASRVVFRDLSPSALLLDGTGLLWFATDRRGVARFDPTAVVRAELQKLTTNGPATTDLLTSPLVRWFIQTNGMSSNHAWDLLADRRGTIWVAAETGLSRLTPTRAENPTPTAAGADSFAVFVFTPAHGLPDHHIDSMIEDDLGSSGSPPITASVASIQTNSPPSRPDASRACSP